MKPVRFDVAGAALTGWELGDGPRVLLLHAGGESCKVWVPVARRVVANNHVRCIAIDQRGHGSSTGRRDSLTDYGDDTAAVLAAEPGACIVVGASLGGFAAIDALRHRAARRATAGIVLVDVVPDPDPARTRNFLAARGMAESNRLLTDDILGAASRLQGLIAAAGVPVLLVRATQSVISEDEVQRLSEAVSDFTVASIDAGHLLAREAPIELADAIGTALTNWKRKVTQ